MYLGHLFFKTDGRIDCKTWWLSTIAIAVLVALTGMLWKKFGFHDAIFGVILSILALWMRINVNIKRLHDRGKSGWWVLFAEIPIIGWIYGLIAFGFLRGNTKENGHGHSNENDTDDDKSVVS